MRTFLLLSMLAAVPAAAQVSVGGASTVTLATAAATYRFGPGLAVAPGSAVTDLMLHTVEVGMTGAGSFATTTALQNVVFTGAVSVPLADSLRVQGTVLCPSGSLTGGTLRLEGSAAQTIGSGCVLPRLSIDKTGGDVTAAGAFAVTGDLRLTDDTLRLGAATLTLGGHLLGSALARTGTLALGGAADQHLAGRLYVAGLTVNKTGGAAVLGNDLDVRGPLTLAAGNLDLNGYAVELVGPAAVLAETGGRVTGATGAITARGTLAAPDAVNLGGLGAEITSAANLGATRVTRRHGTFLSGGAPSIARAFEIEPTNNAGLDALLVFRYRDEELGPVPEAALKLFSSSDAGATWALRGGTVSAASNRITLSGVDHFSLWTAGEAGAFPVELASFEAAQSADDAFTATWTTASETNSAAFHLDVQAEHDAAWREVAVRPGHGTTTERHTYAATVAALDAGRYRLRLRQVDTDGTVNVHGGVEVFIGMREALRARFSGANPARSATALALAVREPQALAVSVSDVTGREVLHVATEVLAASQTVRVPLDVSGLGSGAYFVRVTGEAGVAQMLRLVVAR